MMRKTIVKSRRRPKYNLTLLKDMFIAKIVTMKDIS